MKYKFVEVEEDITELQYKDKKFQAKRNLQLVKDYEEVERKAKIQFIKDLNQDGMSIKDLVVEKTEGNKTYLDYSNVDYLQSKYVEAKKLEFFENFCKSITGMSIEQLVDDIGLETGEEITKFGFEFSQMITGIRKQDDFPSEEKTK